MKIFQRSHKDFRKKLLEDLPKKINLDLLKKIFIIRVALIFIKMQLKGFSFRFEKHVSLKKNKLPSWHCSETKSIS